MFPPIYSTKDGQKYVEYVLPEVIIANFRIARDRTWMTWKSKSNRTWSRDRPGKFILNRKNGICPVREDLHNQLFDEIIR